jgi:polyisoprenoid-binding protein YceI
MKSFLLALGLVSLAAPLAGAQNSTWAVDPNHSEVDFTVRHMGVSNVHGRIGGIKGNIVVNDTDATKSTVSVTIDVNTIDTGVSGRDSDLKSPNWFDVTKFPAATFESTSVTVSGGHMKIDGNLTLHGVKRPIELDVDGPSPTIPGMDNKPHSGYSASTIVKRKDFGVGEKFPATVVGDDIKLTIDLEVVKQ